MTRAANGGWGSGPAGLPGGDRTKRHVWLLSLTLVLLSASLHASWNLIGWNAVIMTPYVVMHRRIRQIRGVWHRQRWVLVMSGLCGVGA